jgi:glycosyltransferase involved in cell wall biosynthesis
MKVSVLIGNLASNGTLRAWTLATLAARHHGVEIIGLLKPGDAVLPWCTEYPYVIVPSRGLIADMREMERRITGDLVIANCLSMTSFGVGLLAKLRRRLPLILDMPEWEAHDHFRWKSRGRRALMIARHLVGEGWGQPHSFKYRYLLDYLTWLADERLVCCEFLKERYGGVVLPQGVDAADFDPSRFDKMAIRRQWGIPEDATILFFGGNPQPSKGLEETLAALEALGDRVKARLVIVGRDETHPYTKKLVDRGRGNVIAIGPQPFSKMPEFLAMADLVALPQTRETKSRGYVPCKIFEAMAMKIPVIGSDICDFPLILEGCGYIVPPEDAPALQAMIEHVLTNPAEARLMGERSRQRVIDRYSWDVMDRLLRDAIASVAPGASRRAARATTSAPAPDRRTP